MNEIKLRYKKKMLWIIVIALFVGIVTAACFFTNPVKTVNRILEERNYTVLDQEWHDITLSVPVSALSEGAFSKEGEDFPKNKIVAYRDDTTTIYLFRVQYANEGDDKMYFCFDADYDLPKEGGTLLIPMTKRVSDGTFHNGFLLRSKTLRDDVTLYENAVLVRGQGPDQKIYFYVSTDAVRASEKNIYIDISLNRLTYTHTNQ